MTDQDHRHTAPKRTLTVSVNSRFSFLLNDLTSQFTRFELAEFTALRSSYAKECYRRLEQAERAEGEKPSPEQVKALALRMAEQRERAAEDPTQDMNRPEPSGDEPLDLSEPEDLGESGPFEERSAPRTKADLLREIRQRADRRTGQQEAEQRQIDPWQVQPPQRRGYGR